MTAPRRFLTAVWRLLVLLVPITLLGPIAGMTWALIELAPTAADPFTQISLFFGILLLGALTLLLSAGVIAAVFALRGQPAVALIVLGAIGALLLPIALWPGTLRSPFTWLLALPGGIAFAAALVGFPQLLGRAGRATAIAVALLLAVPVVAFGGFRTYVAGYYAQACPPGPSVDLTITGQESAHFSSSCGLSRSGSERSGCRNGTATVGLLTWDGLWFLDISAGGTGTVTSEKVPNAAPSLSVFANTSYGGPYGWRGYYRVDGPCRGYIDADLYSPAPPAINLTGGGPVPPVHVKGTWETPIVS